MHWNDKLFTGKQDDWHWGVAISNEANPYPLLLNAFPQKFLVDYPNKSKAHVIRANYSPYADEHDGYEWFVFDKPSCIPTSFQSFTCYSCFNLADYTQLTRSLDPTWDQHPFDELPSLQLAFWHQLDTLQPLAYLGLAFDHRLIIVSKDHSFVSDMLQYKAKA